MCDVLQATNYQSVLVYIMGVLIFGGRGSTVMVPICRVLSTILDSAIVSE